MHQPQSSKMEPASWIGKTRQKIKNELDFQRQEFSASAVEFRARNPKLLTCLETVINTVAKLGSTKPMGLSRHHWMRVSLLCAMLSLMFLCFASIGLWRASRPNLLAFNWLSNNNYEHGFWMTLHGYVTHAPLELPIDGQTDFETEPLKVAWATCALRSVTSGESMLANGFVGTIAIELYEQWPHICGRCKDDRGFAVFCFLISILSLLFEIPSFWKRRSETTDTPIEKFSVVLTVCMGMVATLCMYFVPNYGCVELVKQSLVGKGGTDGPGYIFGVISSLFRFISLFIHIALAAGDGRPYERVDLMEQGQRKENGKLDQDTMAKQGHVEQSTSHPIKKSDNNIEQFSEEEDEEEEEEEENEFVGDVNEEEDEYGYNEQEEENGELLTVSLTSKTKLGIAIAQDDDYGVFVSSITNDSEAQVLGVREGDRIVKVNDTYLPENMSHADAGKLIKSSGRPLKLTLERFEDEELNERIHIASMPLPEDHDGEREIVHFSYDSFGIENKSNDDDDDGRLIVSQVEKGSIAFDAGIKLDDEIVAVNGVRWSEASQKETERGASKLFGMVSTSPSKSSASSSKKTKQRPSVIMVRKDAETNPDLNIFEDVITSSARPLFLTIRRESNPTTPPGSPKKDKKRSSSRSPMRLSISSPFKGKK